MAGFIQVRSRRWASFLIAAVCLSNAGCLLALAGAAGAGGYAYYRGSMSETYDGDFATLWTASHDSLTALALPIVRQSQDGITGTVESVTGAEKKIMIHIEQQAPKIPTDPIRTEVSVRVGTFGDEEVSRRILNEISYRRPVKPLVSRGPSTPVP